MMFPSWYTPPPKRHTRTRTQRFIEEACFLSDITLDELMGGDRHDAYARPRHALRYVLSRVRPDYSLMQIARVTGCRDHTTVLNSLQRATQLRKRDPHFNELVLKLEAVAW